MSISRWGVASVIALLAVLPTAALGWRFAGPAVVAEIPALILLIGGTTCSVVAAQRGSPWWLAVAVPAALWGAVTLFVMIVPE